MFNQLFARLFIVQISQELREVDQGFLRKKVSWLKLKILSSYLNPDSRAAASN